MKHKIKPGDYTNKACLFPEEKDRTRNLVFEFAERSTTLMDSDNKIAVPIIDLCGRGAPTYDMIKNKNIMGPKFFYVGVDLDANIIEECRSMFQDSTSIFLNSKIGDVLWAEEFDEVRRCQILILDSHYGTNKKNYYRGDIIDCIDFAKKQKEMLGEFLLVINICHGRFSTSKHLKKYCEFLTKEVGREITESDFIFYKSKVEQMMWIAISFGF